MNLETERWSFLARVQRRAHVLRGWAGIRPLVAISETPIARPDLSIATTPGYDPATGCAYLPACELPPISDHPTREDARAALEVLAEPFLDFPYRSDADRSVRWRPS